MSHNLAKAIELVSPAALNPYAKNARLHSPEQVDKIAASISEFGFTNPILVDKEKGVIAGHGRLLAAQKLKLDRVPVVVLDYLTEKQKRAFILADNRLAEDARWDYGLLKEELTALDSFDFDLSAIGFTETELENLLPDLEAEADEILARNPEPSDRKNHSGFVDDSEEDPGEHKPAPKPETEELRKEVIGAKEYREGEFQNFSHTCPRCQFGFN